MQETNMSKTITLKLQQLGEQLVVCIPADIAKAALLVAGQPITLEIPTTPDEIRNAENLTMTLELMLAGYDAEKFNGEALAAPLVGQEIIK
jgi:antitoxin component of MazEF toxin-antitoxin module